MLLGQVWAGLFSVVALMSSSCTVISASHDSLWAGKRTRQQSLYLNSTEHALLFDACFYLAFL